MTGTSVGNIWWSLPPGWRQAFESAHAYRRQRQAHITCRQLFMTVIPRSVRIVTGIFFCSFALCDSSGLIAVGKPKNILGVTGKVYFALGFNNFVLLMNSSCKLWKYIFLCISTLHIVSCLLRWGHWLREEVFRYPCTNRPIFSMCYLLLAII